MPVSEQEPEEFFDHKIDVIEFVRFMLSKFLLPINVFMMKSEVMILREF